MLSKYCYLPCVYISWLNHCLMVNCVKKFTKIKKIQILWKTFAIKIAFLYHIAFLCVEISKFMLSCLSANFSLFSLQHWKKKCITDTYVHKLIITDATHIYNVFKELVSYKSILYCYIPYQILVYGKFERSSRFVTTMVKGND